MSIIEGFLEFMTNTGPGALIDVIGGRGGDGVWNSSAENYVRPDPALAPAPNLTINAGAVQMNTPKVELIETAPAQEVGPVEVPQQSAEEIAFNQAYALAQQNRQEQQQEQSP